VKNEVKKGRKGRRKENGKKIIKDEIKRRV
jgi:hypothetical protein